MMAKFFRTRAEDKAAFMEEEKIARQMLADAQDRAERGIEDANPADDEPIIARIDLTKGCEPDNLRLISGLTYKIFHGLVSPTPEVEAKLKAAIDNDRVQERLKLGRQYKQAQRIHGGAVPPDMFGVEIAFAGRLLCSRVFADASNSSQLTRYKDPTVLRQAQLAANRKKAMKFVLGVMEGDRYPADDICTKALDIGINLAMTDKVHGEMLRNMNLGGITLRWTVTNEGKDWKLSWSSAPKDETTSVH